MYVISTCAPLKPKPLPYKHRYCQWYCRCASVLQCTLASL